MNTLIVLVLALFGVFFSLGYVHGQVEDSRPPIAAQATAQATPTTTPTTNSCPPTRNSQQDIDDALAFGHNLFNFPAWTVSITNDVNPLDTNVSWVSDQFYSVVFVELLHYDCGLTQHGMKYFLKTLNFQVIFSNYRSHTQLDQCQAGETSLFEFDVVESNGSSYRAFYWVKQVSPTRVVALNLVFPQSEQAKQASYARRLFPELPTCPPSENNNSQSDAIAEER